MDHRRPPPLSPLVAVEMSAGWIVMLLLAALATRGVKRLVVDGGIRCRAAPVVDRLLRASRTKSVFNDADTRQPTMRRAKTSMTKAT